MEADNPVLELREFQETPYLDFGIIKPGRKAVRKLTLRNPWDFERPVRILEVRSPEYEFIVDTSVIVVDASSDCQCVFTVKNSKEKFGSYAGVVWIRVDEIGEIGERAFTMKIRFRIELPEPPRRPTARKNVSGVIDTKRSSSNHSYLGLRRDSVNGGADESVDQRSLVSVLVTPTSHWKTHVISTASSRAGRNVGAKGPLFDNTPGDFKAPLVHSSAFPQPTTYVKKPEGGVTTNGGTVNRALFSSRNAQENLVDLSSGDTCAKAELLGNATSITNSEENETVMYPNGKQGAEPADDRKVFKMPLPSGRKPTAVRPSGPAATTVKPSSTVRVSNVAAKSSVHGQQNSRNAPSPSPSRRQPTMASHAGLPQKRKSSENVTSVSVPIPSNGAKLSEVSLLSSDFAGMEIQSAKKRNIVPRSPIRTAHATHDANNNVHATVQSFGNKSRTSPRSARSSMRHPARHGFSPSKAPGMHAVNSTSTAPKIDVVSPVDSNDGVVENKVSPSTSGDAVLNLKETENANEDQSAPQVASDVVEVKELESEVEVLPTLCQTSESVSSTAEFNSLTASPHEAESQSVDQLNPTSSAEEDAVAPLAEVPVILTDANIMEDALGLDCSLPGNSPHLLDSNGLEVCASEALTTASETAEINCSASERNYESEVPEDKLQVSQVQVGVEASPIDSSCKKDSQDGVVSDLVLGVMHSNHGTAIFSSYERTEQTLVTRRPTFEVKYSTSGTNGDAVLAEGDETSCNQENSSQASAASVIDAALAVTSIEDPPYLAQLENAARIIQRSFRATRTPNDRLEFLALKSAVRTIECRWAAQRAMKKERRAFLEQKAAVVVLQQRYHANVAAKVARADYLELRLAAVNVSARFRANRACKLERARFLALREASVVIQTRFRANQACRLEQERFLQLRNEASVIQTRFRANQRCKLERARFLELRNAASVIQTRFRANQRCKLERARFIELQNKTRSIQALYRANKACKVDRTRYLNLRNAVLFVQAQYRANVACRIERTRFLQWRAAALIISSRFQANKARDVERCKFLCQKTAAVAIQSWFRATCAASEQRATYLTMKSAAITLQRRFRAKRAADTARHDYLRLRAAAVVVQERFRATQTAKKTRKHFLEQKAAAECIQHRYRALVSMRNDRAAFLANRQAAVTVQRCWRAREARMAFVKLREATVSIQQRFRANQLACAQRAEFVAVRRAAIFVQRTLRARAIGRQDRAAAARRRAAIVEIQRAFRAAKVARQTRSEFVALRDTVVRIQAVWRSALARIRLRREADAALCIQRVLRGYLVRKRLRDERLTRVRRSLAVAADESNREIEETIAEVDAALQERRRSGLQRSFGSVSPSPFNGSCSPNPPFSARLSLSVARSRASMLGTAQSIVQSPVGNASFARPTRLSLLIDSACRNEQMAEDCKENRIENESKANLSATTSFVDRDQDEKEGSYCDGGYSAEAVSFVPDSSFGLGGESGQEVRKIETSSTFGALIRESPKPSRAIERDSLSAGPVGVIEQPQAQAQPTLAKTPASESKRTSVEPVENASSLSAQAQEQAQLFANSPRVSLNAAASSYLRYLQSASPSARSIDGSASAAQGTVGRTLIPVAVVGGTPRRPPVEQITTPARAPASDEKQLSDHDDMAYLKAKPVAGRPFTFSLPRKDNDIGTYELRRARAVVQLVLTRGMGAQNLYRYLEVLGTLASRYAHVRRYLQVEDESVGVRIIVDLVAACNRSVHSKEIIYYCLRILRVLLEHERCWAINTLERTRIARLLVVLLSHFCTPNAFETSQQVLVLVTKLLITIAQNFEAEFVELLGSDAQLHYTVKQAFEFVRGREMSLLASSRSRVSFVSQLREAIHNNLRSQGLDVAKNQSTFGNETASGVDGCEKANVMHTWIPDRKNEILTNLRDLLRKCDDYEIERSVAH